MLSTYRDAVLERYGGGALPDRAFRLPAPIRSRLAEARKQYHFWPGRRGLDAWDVDRLIEATQGLPLEDVLLADLREIDSVYWFDSTQRPTVRKVVEHIRLTQDVDPMWPIILGPDNRVMDGMHRVARALLAGQDTIRAVRLQSLPEPDFPRLQT